MSKKSFDYIENKIKEASENTEPAFEEQAWEKMEAKLNKEKNRRFIPFLWLFAALAVIVTAGGLMLYNNQSVRKTIPTESPNSVAKNNFNNAETKSQSVIGTSGNQKAAADNQLSVSTLNKKANETSTKEINNNSKNINKELKNTKEISNKEKNTTANKNRINNKELNKTDNTNDITDQSTVTVNKKKKISAKIGDKKSTISTNYKAYTKTISKDNNREQFVSTSSSNYTSHKNAHGATRSKTKIRIKEGAQNNEEATTDAGENEMVVSDKDSSNKKTLVSLDKIKIKDTVKSVVPKDTAAIKSEKNTAKKETKQGRSHFYLLASIGADASNVSLLSFNNSSVTPRYGAGIGYQLNKRISVQTGFYAGRKKYIAGPNDYHAKGNNYINTANISKIDANCLIFEIPVTVRYNILQRSKITYYATAGISSFIMKKEDYDYYYVANNYNYQTAHSYTGNKNLFSVVALSVGIEKKISKAFSIQAEPSVNIPIAGVGEGSVKLYSTELQLGIKYNLFR